MRTATPWTARSSWRRRPPSRQGRRDAPAQVGEEGARGEITRRVREDSCRTDEGPEARELPTCTSSRHLLESIVRARGRHIRGSSPPPWTGHRSADDGPGPGDPLTTSQRRSPPQSQAGIRARFEKAAEKKKHAADSVAAGPGIRDGVRRVHPLS